MATVQLGAIITKIAGSIGGTNFRRHRASTVISNKTSGGSKNKLRNNPRLSQLTKVIQGWSSLSVSDRSAWNTQSSNFQFPDKFGNMKNLTGRQLYIKLNTQAIVGGLLGVNVNTLSSTTPAMTNVSVSTYTTSSIVGSVGGTTVAGSLLVSYEYLFNDAIAPTFKRRKVYSALVLNPLGSFSGASNILDFYPKAVAGDKFRIYLQTINASGFKSAMQYVEIVLS